jgi:hypothetical protein
MQVKHLAAQFCSLAFALVAAASAPTLAQAPVPTVNPRSAPQTGQIVAIRAGRLFDSRTGTLLRNQIVLITGDQISDVGPNVAIPARATTIDLSRATVLPGMIDGHLHLSGGNARHHIPVSNDGQGIPAFGRADGV